MKKNIVIIILVSIIIILGGTITCFLINQNNSSYNDTLKIKYRYESLNGSKTKDGNIYQDVIINEKVNFNELNIEEANDFLKNDTGILFIGAEWCSWSRNAIQVLIENAVSNDLSLNYLDITKVRNEWQIKNNNLVKIQEEKNGYYELLNILDEYLDDGTYKLIDNKGNKYDTKEKRIYLSTVVAVKNGNIQGLHIGTVNLNKKQNEYDRLTEMQTTELYEIYQNLIKQIKNNDICNNPNSCD